MNPVLEARPTRRMRAFLYGCFFLSGASALIYEVVWVRQLLLTFGTTTSAVSTVLSAFMLGLALGAYAFGRAADRSRAPLRLYAYLEAGIGAYALCLPTVMAWTSPVYIAAARAVGDQPALLTLLRLAHGFALLLVPTVLMGATLPVLVRFVGRSEARFGWDLGTLYGMNIAGAVVGCAAAGFALIRALGVHGATRVAVVVNLAIALAALLVRPGAPAAPGPSAAPAREVPERSGSPPASLPRGARAALWTIVGLSGAVTMGYEVLWTRILIFSFPSTVYSFTVILATFLAGLALGSWLFAAIIEGKRDRLRALAGIQMLSGLSALALAPLSAKVYDFTVALSERLGYTGTVQLAGTVVASALVMLGPATLMGIVFPLGSRLLVADLRGAGRRVGAAYMVNTLGAVLGSLATGFGLIPLLALKGSLMALAGAQVAVGWGLLPWGGWPPARRRQVVAVSGIALGLGFAAVAALLRGPNPFDPLGRFTFGLPEAIEAHHDGVTASVSVVRYRQGARAMRIDGFETAADQLGRFAYMRMMTHIPMLLHPDPRRLLVISFGTGTTAGTGLLYPGARIDAVEINRTVFDFAGYFREVNRDVARDPRARLIVNDGRNYVLTSLERYDVITSEPMPPTFAGMVNLYSREYYRLARERLNPGGLLVQYLPFHHVRLDEGWAILRTVQAVFPETTLWLYERNGIIVARRDGPVAIDLATIRRRLGEPPLREELRRLGVAGEADLVNLYSLGPAALGRLTAQAAVVTDDRPSLEFHPPRSPVVRRVGRYRWDHALSLEALFRLTRWEPLPLRHATPNEAAALRALHQLSSYDRLGGLYFAMGFAPLARAEFEEGLRHAATPATRARFLFALARVARLEGRTPEARRLVEESLALDPGNPSALQWRAVLDGQ